MDRLYIPVITLHLSIAAKKHSIATITQLRSLELLIKNSSTAYVILYKLIDTWFLDSNRRVGVWSLPWGWHILSIPLTTGRGTSAETCGLDDVFPPDDLGSRPGALVFMYVCMCIPYMSSVKGRIYNGGVIQYWRSCTPSRYIGLYYWGVRGSWAECQFVSFGLPTVSCSLIKSLILGCLWPLVFVLNNTLILGIWCSTIPHLPGCFCPWTFFENIGFNTVLTDPYVTSSYSTWIFCRVVSGLATDCPCGVWCRGLTTCLLHVGPPFGNRILNNSWAVGLT